MGSSPGTGCGTVSRREPKVYYPKCIQPSAALRSKPPADATRTGTSPGWRSRDCRTCSRCRPARARRSPRCCPGSTGDLAAAAGPVRGARHRAAVPLDVDVRHPRARRVIHCGPPARAVHGRARRHRPGGTAAHPAEGHPWGAPRRARRPRHPPLPARAGRVHRRRAPRGHPHPRRPQHRGARDGHLRRAGQDRAGREAGPVALPVPAGRPAEPDLPWRWPSPALPAPSWSLPRCSKPGSTSPPTRSSPRSRRGRRSCSARAAATATGQPPTPGCCGSRRPARPRTCPTMALSWTIVRPSSPGWRAATSPATTWRGRAGTHPAAAPGTAPPRPARPVRHRSRPRR